jgi:cation transport ATPase
VFVFATANFCTTVFASQHQGSVHRSEHEKQMSNQEENKKEEKKWSLKSFTLGVPLAAIGATAGLGAGVAHCTPGWYGVDVLLTTVIGAGVGGVVESIPSLNLKSLKTITILALTGVAAYAFAKSKATK